MEEKAILVATSKEHYNQPQRGEFVEEVITIKNAEEIIRSHMNEVENGGWIPCSERLPEEHDSMFAKVSDEANVTTIDLEEGTRKTETDYTLDGKWHIEINNRVVKKKVIAWQPLPKEYKGE